MNTPLTAPDCLEVMDRFDSYLDGDLDSETIRQFEEHLAACPTCDAEQALALKMSTAFGEMEMERCPNGLFERAISVAKASQYGQADLPLIARKQQPRVRRWRVFALAATILLVLGLGSLRFLLNSAEAEYSAEEIAQARQDVGFALRLVSDAGRETGVFIQNDVLGKEVVEPIQRSLNPTPLTP